MCNVVCFRNFYFDLRHYTVEPTKNIYCAKGKGAVDQTKVTRLYKKFRLDRKSLDLKAKISSPKTVDSEAVF